MIYPSGGLWLDEREGGWIHVHENFGVGEIEGKAEEVREEIQGLVDRRSHDQSRRVEVEQINRLKSYAPGVMHCVVDIYVPPSVTLQQ